jgi:hypothetical protein
MVINDGQARRIAMEWHGGQSSALYSFGSCGAVIDLERLRNEISRDLQQLDVGIERRELLALDKYVRNAGRRPEVPGWSRLWDDSAVELNHC